MCLFSSSDIQTMYVERKGFEKLNKINFNFFSKSLPLIIASLKSICFDFNYFITFSFIMKEYNGRWLISEKREGEWIPVDVLYHQSICVFVIKQRNSSRLTAILLKLFTVPPSLVSHGLGNLDCLFTQWVVRLKTDLQKISQRILYRWSDYFKKLCIWISYRSKQIIQLDEMNWNICP